MAKWKRGDRCPAEKMHNDQFLIKESKGVSDFVFILVNANYTEGIHLTYPPGCSHSEWSQILSITSLLSFSVCDSWFSSFSVLLGGRGFQWDIGVEILIITYIDAQNFLYAIHMVQATYNLPDHCVESRTSTPTCHNTSKNIIWLKIHLNNI